jgi:glycosyltransferase involved in cell wall biosynthesis
MVDRKNTPAVSVVIPAYNAARFLREAIDTAMAQTFTDYEIIVIDDGSTDATESIARSFGDKVRYFRQQNRGASAARNEGIRKATGKYIAFLDSDDLWAPEKLAVQVRILDQDEETSLVYSDWALTQDNGPGRRSFLEIVPGASGRVFDDLIQRGFVLTSTVLVRHSCLDEVGAFDEALPVVEDYDLWLRIAHRWKFALIKDRLVTKRNWEGNLSSDTPKAAANKILVFKKALIAFPNLTPRRRRLIRQQMALSYWDIGYDSFDRFLMPEARRNFRSSLMCDWTCLKSLAYFAAACLPEKIVRGIKDRKRAEGVSKVETPHAT